jgi:SAM-dependent methyltransferase
MLDSFRDRLTLQNLTGFAYRRGRIAFARLFGRDWAAAPQTSGLGGRLAPDEKTQDLLCRPLSTPLPSEKLIHLVNGHRDKAQFAASRAATVGNIIALLREAEIDYRQFRSILDFGCGCGRILAGWEHILSKDVALHGFDINPELVEFCRENIALAESAVNSEYPPLPLSHASVDFAYAASVWTHLSLQASREWAAEFARVIRPGGVAFISYHGSYFEHVVERLGWRASKIYRQTGFYMHSHVRRGRSFAGSNEYATFATTTCFGSLFNEFKLLRNYAGIVYGPNPFAACQDIAVLQRL